jgi:Ca-activated chloride channel family protein
MLNFAWPWMILIVPLPLVLRHWLKNVRASKIKRTPEILFPNLQRLQAAFGSPRNEINRLLNWKLILGTIAWICLCVCLMRPELVKDVAYADNTGYDLLLAVDISRSMEIVDFSDHGKPISRIAATKKVVSNFVQHRTGDRIGLIVFAEQAFLTIPLTLDTTSVVKMLNNLLIGMAGESTALGDAIGIGVQNLRKRPVASRVLILLTDGIDTASHIPPLEAAKIAAADKIKIYAIGVGDQLDDKLLEKISSMTGGTYSKVTSVDALENVYREIDQLEKSETAQQALLIRKPLYHWFLLVTMISLAILYIVNTRQYRYEHDYE